MVSQYLSVTRLRRDQSGSIMMFGILMVVLMLGFAGFAVDLMRVEARRAAVQGALDSALLAAADMDQKGDPAKVVKDYMTKAGFGDELDGDPIIEYNGISRTVTASIRQRTWPIFHIYQKPFTYVSEAAASNAAPTLEVSLVVDISGSMGEAVEWTYDYWGRPWVTATRMDELQKGARRFVTTLLGDGERANVSVSVIPFSEQVGIGAKLYDAIGYPRRHNYSHCVDLPDSSFQSIDAAAKAPFPPGLIQTQHFQYAYTGYRNTVIDTVCPQYDYEQIIPLSRNATAIADQIDDMVPRTGTAIFYGVKWGVMLLDPDLRQAITRLTVPSAPGADDNMVDEVFDDRPYDYGTPGAHKILVVMSDGENSTSYRMRDHLYDTQSEIDYWATTNYEYWFRHIDRDHSRSAAEYAKYDYYSANMRMAEICAAAKARGITIYSVGVHMTQYGSGPLRSCASSPAHYYGVDATEIDEAFTSIAVHSMNLRLIK